MYMNFWDRLKDELKDRDLTQAEAARKLKIPIGTFKNWLLRQTYPDAREVIELAKLLNTTVEHLVDGVDCSSDFTEDERRLIDGYRRLSKYDQGHFAVIVDAWRRKFKGK
jgi:transcriptional regulator with XRE-family HTH domain